MALQRSPRNIPALNNFNQLHDSSVDNESQTDTTEAHGPVRSMNKIQALEKLKYHASNKE
jgi:hypothetical protein